MSLELQKFIKITSIRVALEFQFFIIHGDEKSRCFASINKTKRDKKERMGEEMARSLYVRDIAMYIHRISSISQFRYRPGLWAIKIKNQWNRDRSALPLFCCLRVRNREKYLSLFRKETPSLIAALSRSH